MRWQLRVRFDFDQPPEPPTAVGDALVFRHGGLQLGVKTFSAGDPQPDGPDLDASFAVRSGETADVVLLACADAALPSPSREAVQRRLQNTRSLWRTWSSRVRYDGPWRDAVERSLLTLRLLADGRTGAIAAAGTTSLPEVIGGSRNYDYRFAWVRDLSFTVDALLRVGVEELSHASVRWLLGAVARTSPRVDPVYALDGSVIRSQHPIDLAGWRRTAPVHLGNQAGSQLQLGGFGDLVETVYRFAECGHVLSPRVGEQLADTVDLLCAIWEREDAGLWELGETAHYATSKIGCWTAVRRLLDLVERGQAPPRHLERWRRERDRIRTFIETHLWSERHQSYLMKAGSDALDCGVLLAARRGFTDPRGERMRGTIDAILRELRAGDAVFYRYSGMDDEENCFIACSFWVVEALALAGRVDEAAEIMDGAVTLANDVGLLSEEVRAADGSLRGNLPQALSHLALVSAAAFLEHATHDG
jgi:GH15 family glucan-1,4-alpha-glucosidase